MKKIYILLACVFLFGQNRAQHTLTAAFNPAIGDVESYINLDTAGLFLGSSGVAQTWNYTGISTGTNAPYSNTYVAMSSVPNNSLYPTGTIAIDIGVAGYHYVYSNMSSKVEWLGAAQPTASNCSVYSDPEILYTLPFTYGSSSFDTYSNTASTTGTTTTTGDGTGTLQLPSGNYSNILKITIIEQTSGPITYATNRYYSALSKFPLLTINSATIGSIIYKSGLVNTSVALAISRLSEIHGLNFFPNPVTDGELFITDEKNEIRSVSFINVLGQTVKTISFGNNTIDNKKVDVNELAKGVYYLRLDSNQGILIKKIVIE